MSTVSNSNRDAASRALASLFGPDLEAGPILARVPAVLTQPWVHEQLQTHGFAKVPLPAFERSHPGEKLRPMAEVDVVLAEVMSEDGYHGATLRLRTEEDVEALRRWMKVPE